MKKVETINKDELCRVDRLRYDVKEIGVFKHILNYLTIMLDLTVSNPLFNDKEKLEYLEEIIAVQKEFKTNVFEQERKDLKEFMEEWESDYNG